MKFCSFRIVVDDVVVVVVEINFGEEHTRAIMISAKNLF